MAIVYFHQANMAHFTLMIIAVLILTIILASAEFECYDYDSDKETVPRKVGNCKACVNVTIPNSGMN
jgi:hypothetical protein